MKLPLRIAMLALVANFLLSIPASAQTTRCGLGKVLTVDSRTDLEPTVSTSEVIEQDKKGKKNYRVITTPDQRKQLIYTLDVAINGLVYTVESRPILPPFTYVPRDIVAGDPIEGCIEGRSMLLTRPNGKRFKTTILRTRRDGAAVEASNGVPAIARAKFKSEPDGADIRVDGKYVGSTPSEIDLTTGTHVVVVSRRGFREWSRTITVTSGDINVNAEMERAP